MVKIFYDVPPLAAHFSSQHLGGILARSHALPVKDAKHPSGGKAVLDRRVRVLRWFADAAQKAGEVTPDSHPTPQWHSIHFQKKWNGGSGGLGLLFLRLSSSLSLIPL